MSEDLVKRLRDLAIQSNDGVLRGPALAAADRIEGLEPVLAKAKQQADRIEELEAKLAKAVEALVQISRIELTFPEELRPTARAALAEINGESHE